MSYQINKALVVGASGFVGAHLVRELIKQNIAVRIMVRATSDISMLDGLSFETSFGDVSDSDSMVNAMQGCDTVFHSAVNTGAWLTDSGPLYQTNVLGVINAIAAAKKAHIQRFVLTSSLLTIGRAENEAVANEDCYPDNASLFTEYMRSRCLAEHYLLLAAKEEGFPAIACCVSNTYGDQDVQPTPHGNLIKQVALGRAPVYLNAASEVVNVKDAARALILAAQKGRPGSRYIISDRFMSNQELFSKAAAYAGRRPPWFACPTPLVSALVFLVESLMRLLRKDSVLTHNSVKLMYQTWPLSHQKAVDELGWELDGIDSAIAEAVDFYKSQK